MAMLLRLGDVGDRVKALQRGLNKLGALLRVDGHLGFGTRDAIAEARTALGLPGPPQADDGFQVAVSALPELFPPLTSAGVTFIARAEVSSASAYRQKYQAPCWPSAASGITIGIGYDCRFVTREQFESDWAGVLPLETIERLALTLGRMGSTDRLALVRGVVVPLRAAMAVFASRSLAQYLDQTRRIYPQIDTLSAPRRTALVSLVYNRGFRLTDQDEARQDRLEMRAIRELLASGHADAVADQIDAMARLWDPQTLGGLVQRRHAEATLWRSGFSALQLD
jgi:GH24 family phage-related lysozyme (muramidase)